MNYYCSAVRGKQRVSTQTTERRIQVQLRILRAVLCV